MAVPKYCIVNFSDKQMDIDMKKRFSTYCNSSETMIEKFKQNPIGISGTDMREWHQRKQ